MSKEAFIPIADLLKTKKGESPSSAPDLGQPGRLDSQGQLESGQAIATIVDLFEAKLKRKSSARQMGLRQKYINCYQKLLKVKDPKNLRGFLLNKIL